VRGIVKNIKVTTIGGVIPPNGELMEIVPVDDHLLIETRHAISPLSTLIRKRWSKSPPTITRFTAAAWRGGDHFTGYHPGRS
jgi:adhesin transport system membrane fusion protein